MGQKRERTPREAVKGFIFDVKRFAVHDGPGIRTTIFFKGCPLHCLWCHNPESIDRGPELIIRSARCSSCYSCVKACPKKALSPGPEKGPVVVDRSKCDLCGKCVDACVYEALDIVGRRTTVGDLVDEAERDDVFFEQSGGGVTLSGGEPLAQPAFAVALLGGIEGPRDLDGPGYFGPGERRRPGPGGVAFRPDPLRPEDDGRFRPSPIREIRKRPDSGKPAATGRVAGNPSGSGFPLVAGVNDDEANIAASIAFLKTLSSIRAGRPSEIPQGRAGKIQKSRQAGAAFKSSSLLPTKRTEEIRRAFADAGFNVSIGG